MIFNFYYTQAKQKKSIIQKKKLDVKNADEAV